MKEREIDWSKAPEGATHYLPESDCWFACWFKQVGDVWKRKIANQHEDVWKTDYDMDEAVKFLIQRPSAWDGIGLPPVGAVCEGRGRLDGEWREVVVLAHRIGRAVVSFTDHERLQWCESDELRPIRAPEQIAAEEREKEIDAIEKIIGAAANLGKSAAAAIYDAGYRKVEGEKK